MGIDYAAEKFYEAVTWLVSRPEKLRYKLRVACEFHIANVQQEDVPADLLDDFQWIRRQFSFVQKTQIACDVETACRKMTPAHSKKVAKRIVDLFEALAKKHGAHLAQRGVQP